MKKLNIRQFGIGSLIKYPPLISSDSKYVFTIGDHCVYVWIVKTGQCLRLINEEVDSKEPSKIVSMCINPFNRLQLCVGEENGTIKIWDYEDGILIHKMHLEMEVIEMKSVASQSLFVFVKNSKNVYSLLNYQSVRPKSSYETKFEKLPCAPKSISCDQKGQYCVFINSEGTTVYLLNFLLNQLKTFPLSKANLSFHQKLTCAQIHPHEECIALGTQSGRIALWYSYLNKEMQVSYLHWHSLSVNCLSYSLDGSYLLSGGNECVFVKWIWKKNEPTFLPRLTSPIIYLNSSTDQTFYVSTHLDNSIRILSSNLTIQQTISAINQTVKSKQDSFQAGIHLFSREEAIVINSGKAGYLQFMSIANGKLLYNLDIVGENYVSPSEINEEYLWTDIKRLAIDSSESWLVTFEERSSQEANEDFPNERKLRFWFYNSKEKQFELNTTIEYPHGQQTLNQLLFHPKKFELVTTGNDGFLKVWILIKQTQLKTTESSSWRCLSVHSHRSYLSNALTFSHGNGMTNYQLCCSFEHLVTVWKNEESNLNEESDYKYQFSLSHFDKQDPIKDLISDQNQLIVCHQKLVNFWNVKSKQFLKSFPWNVSTFARDPHSGILAFFEKNFLHFYSLTDGKCHTRKSSIFRHVQSALFLPDGPSSSLLPFSISKLIFYIPREGLKTFVDQKEENLFLQENLPHEEKANLLANLIQQSENPSKEMKQASEHLPQFNPMRNQLNEQFLSTPAYLLPSIETYAVEALKRMLLPAPSNSSADFKDASINEEEMEENLSTMSVDEE